MRWRRKNEPGRGKEKRETRLRNASVEFFTSIGGVGGSLILEKSRLHLPVIYCSVIRALQPFGWLPGIFRD